MPTSPSPAGLRAFLQPQLTRIREALRSYARHNRARLWPLIPLLVLCILSTPLLGAWMRWVELPRIQREQALQPCTPPAAGAGQATATSAQGEKDENASPNAASVSSTATLDARQAALAPSRCFGMRRIDNPTGLRVAAYRFEDGSLFTLHLRAPPTPATSDVAAVDAAAQTTADASPQLAIDAGTEPSNARTNDPDIATDTASSDKSDTAPDVGANIHLDPAARPDIGNNAVADADTAAGTDATGTRPAPAPILTASCPVQSRQSLLVLTGLLLVGVVVILHRLRAGGKFLDFRNIVREPLLPGEVLLLIYAFTLILGTGIGLQFGQCEAAAHRDAVQTELQPTSLKDLAAPMRR